MLLKRVLSRWGPSAAVDDDSDPETFHFDVIAFALLQHIFYVQEVLLFFYSRVVKEGKPV